MVAMAGMNCHPKYDSVPVADIKFRVFMWPRLNLSWKWSGLKLEENSPLKEHREYCSWLILWLYT